MSSDVRARVRPPSPRPPSSGTLPPHYQHVQPRFPQRLQHDGIDADERKAHAKSGSLKHSQHGFGGLKIAAAEWKLLLGIVVLALFVRLYRLSWPNSVVFDEVHFGKFAAKYIKTRYYVDVHPPLAKLLITLMSVFGGFDGDFDFKEIGAQYPPDVPYVLMRSLPALLGVGVVPLAYLTLRALDCRAGSALLGALFVTFENGLITQSRLILLDSPLIFFTALSVFCYVCFSNENHYEPLTEDWWLWLALTGLSLGFVASCKWVGLFTIGTVGISTIKQLWDLLGDLKVSPRVWIKHFAARALCLIVLPILTYMAVFEIHFLILVNSGDGDGFMSAAFQTTLHGKGMQDTWADVALGSEVTMRHVNTQGGYLHSHEHNYPTGSNQQQITLYPHRDSNNVWRIVHANIEGQKDHDYANEPVTLLTEGMQVRFEHVTTQKRLHAHDVRPPVSEVDFQNEVSGYGYPGFVGDANDNWIVEIEYGSRRDSKSWKKVRTIGTTFRLRHALQGCYLFSHKVKLPDWGFEQQEVTCNKNAVKPNSLWYFETNTHPHYTDADEKINYKNPGFIRKFVELQRVMWTTNAGLTDRHTYDSRPHSWPTLHRGINFWVKEKRQVYLMGNPVVWWLGTASVVVYFIARALLILRAKRQFKDLHNTFVVKYDQLCGFLVLGWFMHYFPFFLMSRQLFLHHYFPALYFSILLSCGIFDLCTSWLRPKIRLQVAAVFALAAIATWYHFSPLAYAGDWTKSQCLSSKWVKSWDFSCDAFPLTLDEYSYMHTPPTLAGGAQPHPDGGAPPHGQDGVALESPNLSDSTASAVINQIQPGRDVFQDDAKSNVQSASAEKTPIVGPIEEIVTKQANMGEQENAQAVQPPPPLPKNELKELTKDVPVPSSSEPAPIPQTQTDAGKEEETKGKAKGGESDEERKVREALFPDAA